MNVSLTHKHIIAHPDTHLHTDPDTDKDQINSSEGADLQQERNPLRQQPKMKPTLSQAAAAPAAIMLSHT